MATTYVKTALADLTWPDQAILTIDAGDPAAKIKSVVIHLSQSVPEDVVAASGFIPLFAYGEPAT